MPEGLSLFLWLPYSITMLLSVSPTASRLDAQQADVVSDSTEADRALIEVVGASGRKLGKRRDWLGHKEEQ